MKKKYSVILPAYNEEDAIGSVIEEILRLEPRESFEVIVVDDCSSDKTALRASAHRVQVLTNIQNFGYGYSLKRGISAAQHPNIIILDSDGSYPVREVTRLIQEYEKGFDMVVGARQGTFYHGSLMKRIARLCFRLVSEFTTGRRIPDINSGCRIFQRLLAMRFFPTLSSGFSFTTTITLAFMLNAYSVAYIPIEYHKRKGASKVRYVRDTLRSIQIITEAIIYYNPLKLFLLLALGIFVAGLVSIVVFFISPFFALLFFLTISFTITMLSLGFIAVLLKFMYADA
jgi:glycosyltransferase involved in cell wall biosynthesis